MDTNKKLALQILYWLEDRGIQTEYIDWNDIASYRFNEYVDYNNAYQLLKAYCGVESIKDANPTKLEIVIDLTNAWTKLKESITEDYSVKDYKGYSIEYNMDDFEKYLETGDTKPNLIIKDSAGKQIGKANSLVDARKFIDNEIASHYYVIEFTKPKEWSTYSYGTEYVSKNTEEYELVGWSSNPDDYLKFTNEEEAQDFIDFDLPDYFVTENDEDKELVDQMIESAKVVKLIDVLNKKTTESLNEENTEKFNIKLYTDNNKWQNEVFSELKLKKNREALNAYKNILNQVMTLPIQDLYNKDIVKQLQSKVGKIVEIKWHIGKIQYRIICWRENNTLYLLVPFIKSNGDKDTDKAVAIGIKRFNTIKEDINGETILDIDLANTLIDEELQQIDEEEDLITDQLIDSNSVEDDLDENLFHPEDNVPEDGGNPKFKPLFDLWDNVISTNCSWRWINPNEIETVDLNSNDKTTYIWKIDNTGKLILFNEDGKIKEWRSVDDYLSNFEYLFDDDGEPLDKDEDLDEEVVDETYSKDELDSFRNKVFNQQKVMSIYRKKKYGEKRLMCRTKCVNCGREKKLFLSNLVTNPEKYGSCVCSDTNIDARMDTITGLYKGTKILKSNTSGYTGVYWVSKYRGEPYNKWRAYIEIDGKRNYLGDFNSKSKAIRARKAAAKKGLKWYNDNKDEFMAASRRKRKRTRNKKFKKTQ